MYQILNGNENLCVSHLVPKLQTKGYILFIKKIFTWKYALFIYYIWKKKIKQRWQGRHKVCGHSSMAFVVKENSLSEKRNVSRGIIKSWKKNCNIVA